MTVQDITKLNKQNWQHKRGTIGEVAQDKEDIAQYINTIVTTPKGTVPFMRELGIDFLQAVDESAEDAIEILSAMFKKEIPLQEPRCTITDITGTKNEDGRVHLVIYYTIADNDEEQVQEVYV